MNQLRAFLDDNRITVACFGAGEVTMKLAKEWGLHVAWPVELTDLFALAYGEAAGVEREERLLGVKKPARYWMGKAALKREKAKAQRDEYDTDEEERLNNLGRTWRPPKVVRGLSLERMARVALGPEMRLARCPAKVAQADWGSYDLGDEEWAYATRDAYLCFEIAARCLQKLAATPSASSDRRAPSQLLRGFVWCALLPSCLTSGHDLNLALHIVRSVLLLRLICSVTHVCWYDHPSVSVRCSKVSVVVAYICNADANSGLIWY